jgi:hypothetical protein
MPNIIFNENSFSFGLDNRRILHYSFNINTTQQKKLDYRT